MHLYMKCAYNNKCLGQQNNLRLLANMRLITLIYGTSSLECSMFLLPAVNVNIA